MERVIEARLEERRRAIERAREFVECARRLIDVKEAFVFGSYARGDFNEWSDVDVLIVAERLPRRPLDRLRAVEECLNRYPHVEPIIVTPEELERMRRRRDPIAIEVEMRGIRLC